MIRAVLAVRTQEFLDVSGQSPLLLSLQIVTLPIRPYRKDDNVVQVYARIGNKEHLVALRAKDAEHAINASASELDFAYELDWPDTEDGEPELRITAVLCDNQLISCRTTGQTTAVTP